MKELQFASYIIDMNNSFNKCVSEICGLELETLVSNYKYSVFGGHTAVIEGHKGIIVYSYDEITFAVKKGVLKVAGKNLRIKCLEKHFAVVVGSIIDVGVKADEK